MLAMQHYNASGFVVGPTSLMNRTGEREAEMEAAARMAAAHGNASVGARKPGGNPTAAGLSMTLGVLSNVVALVILAKAYNRFRRRSKVRVVTIYVVLRGKQSLF